MSYTSGSSTRTGPKEKHDAGKRKDKRLATAATEVECVAEMARCLREIREGRWPA